MPAQPNSPQAHAGTAVFPVSYAVGATLTPSNTDSLPARSLPSPGARSHGRSPDVDVEHGRHVRPDQPPPQAHAGTAALPMSRLTDPALHDARADRGAPSPPWMGGQVSPSSVSASASTSRNSVCRPRLFPSRPRAPDLRRGARPSNTATSAAPSDSGPALLILGSLAWSTPLIHGGYVLVPFVAGHPPRGQPPERQHPMTPPDLPACAPRPEWRPRTASRFRWRRRR